MKIIVHDNPMPAVRMTQRSKFKNPQATAYVAFKESLAQELSLRLTSYPRNVEGGKITLQFMDYDQREFPLKTPLSLRVKFYRKDNHSCDIDNLLKMVMDFLQTAGIYKNDNQVLEVHALLFKKQKFGNFTIELTAFPQENTYAQS